MAKIEGWKKIVDKPSREVWKVMNSDMMRLRSGSAKVTIQKKTTDPSSFETPYWKVETQDPFGMGKSHHYNEFGTKEEATKWAIEYMKKQEVN